MLASVTSFIPLNIYLNLNYVRCELSKMRYVGGLLSVSVGFFVNALLLSALRGTVFDLIPASRGYLGTTRVR